MKWSSYLQHTRRRLQCQREAMEHHRDRSDGKRRCPRCSPNASQVDKLRSTVIYYATEKGKSCYRIKQKTCFSAHTRSYTHQGETVGHATCNIYPHPTTAPLSGARRQRCPFFRPEDTKPLINRISVNQRRCERLRRSNVGSKALFSVVACAAIASCKKPLLFAP